ncbi:MAG: S-methyl-5-thioribose-1-phosphate isomerase [Gammaproteobacteria bacterium]|nr:S-methyl-5-thioribose-1-phosphate isomerase [Gammaproteobacteria bacterium]
MNVDGVPYRSIWVNGDGISVDVIDQTRLPHAFEIMNLKTLDDACVAIRDMVVRGAPLIGATAAFGFYLALRHDASDRGMQTAYDLLYATRPTAVNLRWALDRMHQTVRRLEPEERAARAYAEAGAIAALDVETNQGIGRFGLVLIESIAMKKKPGETINILTHCNAGWLATVDWGTATAPIYMAHDAGIPIHVWVDETRPRNQGASLTAWELGHHGVPHSLVVDNAGGHLMQHGLVDLCLVGSDRTTRSGDVCNKIGTYLKALAANDNDVPFYVCLPSTTIDWTISDGRAEIPIEQRDGSEVSQVIGKTSDGQIAAVAIAPDGTPVVNYAFDVTPARLISGLITESGIADANERSLGHAFPKFSARPG